MRKIVPLLLLVVALGACKRREQPAAVTQTGTQAQTQTTTGSAPATTTGVEVGATMPEYTAARLDGAPFDLTKERGQVVLLNLWATWCAPCRLEMPDLQALHDKYSARGFKVVGVSIDQGGAETVKPFIAEEKITYPIVVDPDEKMAAILNTSVLPVTLLLDRNGKILWKRPGQIDPRDPKMIEAIERAIGKG